MNAGGAGAEAALFGARACSGPSLARTIRGMGAKKEAGAIGQSNPNRQLRVPFVPPTPHPNGHSCPRESVRLTDT